MVQERLYDFAKGGTDRRSENKFLYSAHKILHVDIHSWHCQDKFRVYLINNNVDLRKCTSLTCGWNLVKALCNPKIDRKKSQACAFTWITMGKIALMLGHRRQVEEAMTHKNKNRKRCHTCLDLGYGPE